MSAGTVLAALVIVIALPLNWYVTILLLWMSRASPGEMVLRAQAVAWMSLTIIVTVFAAVFVNNSMPDPFLDSEQTMLLTRGTLLVFSVIPALYWLRVVWRRA